MIALGLPSFHQGAQAASLGPFDLQAPQQATALQSRVGARLDGLQARVQEFSRFCNDLALFWSASADSQRASLCKGTNDHRDRIRGLRTELELTCQGMDCLPEDALPVMLERLIALDRKADHLLGVLEEWESFWKAQAEWRPGAVIGDGAESRGQSVLKHR